MKTTRHEGLVHGVCSRRKLGRDKTQEAFLLTLSILVFLHLSLGRDMLAIHRSLLFVLNVCVSPFI